MKLEVATRSFEPQTSIKFKQQSSVSQTCSSERPTIPSLTQSQSSSTPTCERHKSTLSLSDTSECYQSHDAIKVVPSDVEIHTLTRCHDKMVNFFSTDPLKIADILLTEGFLTDDVYNTIRLNTTPREKAAEIVSCIRNKIHISPKLLHKLIDIFLQQKWQEEIVEHLRSVYRGGSNMLH